MSRYQVWNKKDKVITPVGEVLTPEQWIERYPMAEIVDLVIGGGVINGNVCMEYTSFVDSYASMGCDFSNCISQQDHLDAIEAFEDAGSGLGEAVEEPKVTSQQRIADALEDLVVLNMPDVE